jgi:hypothetical protein
VLAEEPPAEQLAEQRHAVVVLLPLPPQLVLADKVVVVLRAVVVLRVVDGQSVTEATNIFNLFTIAVQTP